MIFRSEKRTVFRFLCKSAWLTVGTFSVFISSETCTVKTLKYVPFLSKNAKRNVKPFSVIILERETNREIFKTVFHSRAKKTEFLPFFGHKNGKFTVFWCGTPRAFKI